MEVKINQYDVYLVNLDPTVGHKINKTRPCLVISPDEINENIRTVIIAPMTTKSHDYPTRVKTMFGGKTAWVVIDQIRTIDRRRLVKNIGKINADAVSTVKAEIKEMLVD